VPTLRHSDHDLNEYQDEHEQDREISLGMGTILGLFFGLVLICALFFGFGYSMGRRSSQPATVASSDAAPTSTVTGGAKPSPSSPLKAVEGFFGKKQTPPPTDADDTASANEPPPSSPTPAPESQAQAADQLKQAGQSDQKDGARTRVTQDISGGSASSAPARPAHNAPPSATPVAPSSPMPAISPNGTAMVQVAAVSHQEDADLLLSALKRRGYAVFVRQEPQDHLLHVQVGPFASKKDAEVMRQKLLTDGYNAILK